MHGVRGQPRGAGHVQPLELAGHPQAALIKMDHRLRGVQVGLHLFIGRPDSLCHLLGGRHHGALAHRMPVEVSKNLARPLQGDELILVEIYCLGLQGRPVLHRLGHLGGEGTLGGLPTVRTVFDLGPMLCDLHPHRRKLKDLPSLIGAGGHLLQRGPTVPATLDGVEVEVVWLRHGLQRVALVAWLRPALFAAALAQIVRARLLPSVAARGLAAVAAVFSQLVLQGINPGLEVEDEGSQLTYQGQHGFFALQVGGMDIFWGRQASWCHAVYCARFLSVLHQRMMNFLVCLSSNQKTRKNTTVIYRVILRHHGGQGRRGDDATADGIGVQTAQPAVLPVPIARHRARPRQESRDAVGVDVLDVDSGLHLPATRLQHTFGTVKVLPHGLSQGPVLRDHLREFPRKSPKAKLATWRSPPRSTLAYTRVVSALRCPRWSPISFIEKPWASKRVAQACRKAWGP